MKIFVSYKLAGENPKEVVGILNDISKVLRDNGHEIYSAFMDEDLFIKNKFGFKQILFHALKELDKCDCILVFVKSEEKAEGMLLELGYALAKNKRIILAIKKGLRLPFTEDIADKIIEFDNIDELNEKLKDLK